MLNQDLILSYLSISDLSNDLARARQELLDLRVSLDSIGNLNEIKVSPLTNQLVSFQQRYQDRLIASSIGDREVLKTKLSQELTQMLGDLIALEDYLQFILPSKLSADNLATAREQYSMRAKIVEELNVTNALFENVAFTKFSPEGKVESENWVPLQDLKNRSTDDLIRIITRAIAVEVNVDNDITGLLMVLISGVNREDSITNLFSQYDLPFDLEDVKRDLAEAQQLRDAVAASFAPLLKKLVKKESVQPYEGEFRTAYSIIYNYVKMAYSQTITAHSEWKRIKVATPPTPIPSPPPAAPVPTVAPIKKEEVTPIKPIDLH